MLNLFCSTETEILNWMVLFNLDFKPWFSNCKDLDLVISGHSVTIRCRCLCHP